MKKDSHDMTSTPQGNETLDCQDSPGSDGTLQQTPVTEKALKKSDEKFLRILGLAPIPLCFISPEGEVLFSNRRFHQFFGYSSDEISTIEQWWPLAYPDKDYRDEVMKHWKDAVERSIRENEDIEPAEYRVTCGNGTISTVVISGITVEDGMIITFMDVTERKAMEERLRENERILQEAQEVARIGHYVIDIVAGTWQSSTVMDDIMGIDASFQKNIAHWIMLVAPEHQPLVREHYYRVIEERSTLNVDYKIIRPRDGHVCWLNGRGKLEYNTSGNPARLIGTVQDITERKRIDQVLTFLAQGPEKGQDFFKSLALFMAENLETDFVSISHLMRDGLTARTIALWSDGRFQDTMEYALKGTPCEEALHRTICCYSSGVCTLFPHSPLLRDLKAEGFTCITLYDRNGTPIGLINAISRKPLENSSFTEALLKTVAVRAGSEMERLVAEKKIKSLLSQKEILLKDVHHRIKNNMNTIMSLLSMQAADVEDPNAAGALLEARSRLHSMAVLYEKLYQSENLTDIPIADYLPRLVNEIISLFPHKASVKTEIEIKDFILPVKIVSPLGLIINELLTNAMKYAFSDRGVIRVSAFQQENLITLIVEDNGKGIPESVSIESPGFGLMLVNLLVEQIDGTIRIERGKGTRFILQFPVCSA